MKKYWIGFALVILGFILGIGAAIWGLWLIHPVLGILGLGIFLGRLGKTLLDNY